MLKIISNPSHFPVVLKGPKRWTCMCMYCTFVEMMVFLSAKCGERERERESQSSNECFRGDMRFLFSDVDLRVQTLDICSELTMTLPYQIVIIQIRLRVVAPSCCTFLFPLSHTGECWTPCSCRRSEAPTLYLSACRTGAPSSRVSWRLGGPWLGRELT